MSSAELLALLEEHAPLFQAASCEWDITNIDEGILTVNFYVDETQEDE